jgi:serine/threonine protein kinase
MLYVNASEATGTRTQQDREPNVKAMDWAAIQETLQRKLRSPVLPMTSSTGQYSRIFLVRHRATQRLVKVSSIADGEREAAILQYIRDAPSVRTPCGTFNASMYVPKLYSAGKVGQAYFIVMEFFVGQTLESFLKMHTTQRTPRSLMLVRRARRNLHRVMQALLALGVYHGDLHANNIMVTPHGHVIVLDFGFATIVPELKGHVCGPHPSSIPQSVVSQMRKQHFRYGRVMFHDNREMYARHLDKLNNTIRQLTYTPRASPRRPSRRIVREVSKTPSPFASGAY